MKRFLIISFLLFTLSSFSQKDSTLVYFEYVENEDLRLINELSGIQMITLSCSDTLMHNKHFFLSVYEYFEGQLKSVDSLNMTCVDQEYSMITGEDTIVYTVNYCDYICFDEHKDKFSMRLAGKLIDDSLNLIIKYPSFVVKRKLKGNKEFSLREVISENGKDAKIKVNSKVPVFAYTSPFDSGGGIKSYCLLEGDDPKNWFQKYNIKHYYIFFLEIKNI
ncbi:MAG TPA: hypothetical protein P5132_05775 [Bacteroidales bacterium]|nr:hypothetical protein [Bacteroidales bacterium]